MLCACNQNVTYTLFKPTFDIRSQTMQMATETSSTVSGTKLTERLSYAKAVGSKPAPKIPKPSPPTTSKDDQKTVPHSIHSCDPSASEKNGQSIEHALTALHSKIDQYDQETRRKEHALFDLRSEIDQLKTKGRALKNDASRETLALLVGKPVPEGVKVEFVRWVEGDFMCECNNGWCCGFNCPAAVWLEYSYFRIHLNGCVAYTSDRAIDWRGEHADYVAHLQTEMKKPEICALAESCAKKLAD